MGFGLLEVWNHCLHYKSVSKNGMDQNNLPCGKSTHLPFCLSTKSPIPLSNSKGHPLCLRWQKMEERGKEIESNHLNGDGDSRQNQHEGGSSAQDGVWHKVTCRRNRSSKHSESVTLFVANLQDFTTKNWLMASSSNGELSGMPSYQGKRMRREKCLTSFGWHLVLKQKKLYPWPMASPLMEDVCKRTQHTSKRIKGPNSKPLFTHKRAEKRMLRRKNLKNNPTQEE